MWLLITALATWLVVQLVKFSLRAASGDPDFRVFYQSGGMPSAHAATVTALAVAALAIEGWQSSIFGLSAVFAAIVIYDTLGVRRSSGEQSIMINAISKMIGHTQPVKEVLGHTVKEVSAGIASGAVLGLAFTYPFWSEYASWLVESPLTWERWLYLGIFTLMSVAALLGRLSLRRLRKVAATRTLISVAGWGLALPGLLGLFFVLVQWQTAGAITWRLWPLLILVGFACAHAVLAFESYPFIKQRYREQTHELLKKRRQQRQHQQRRAKQRRKQRAR